MRTKFKGLMLGMVVGFLAISVMGMMMTRNMAIEGTYSQLKLFNEVLALVRSSYVDEVQTDSLMKGAYQGLLAELDPFSEYLTPAEYESYRKGSQENAGKEAPAGPGLRVSRKSGIMMVVSVLPGSDAEAKGITSGDRVRRIGEESTREMNLFEAESLLSGDPGSKVALSLVRREDPHKLDTDLVRQVTPLGPPRLDIVDAKAGVAVLTIPDFGAGVADRVATALAKASKQGVKRLLIDLRGNAWGSFDEAAATVGLFAGDTVVARITGKNGVVSEVRSGRGKAPWHGTLALLIDSGTAEAAELFAAALHDLDDGTLMGENSFGIGAQQDLMPLKNGAWLRLSVRKYVSPSGTAWHGDGLTPSTPLVITQENLKPAERRKLQLDQAVEKLRSLEPARADAAGTPVPTES